MDRTQHKCFLASAILHGALLLTVIVVSAFTKPPPDVPKTALTYVPINAKNLPGTPTPAAPTVTEVTPAPTQPAPPPPPPPPPPPQATKVETKTLPPVKDDVVPKKPAPATPRGLLPPKEKAKPKEEAKKLTPSKTEKVEPKKAAQPKKDESKIKIVDTAKLTAKNPPKETDSNSKSPDSNAKKKVDQYARMRADWEKSLQGTIGGLKTGLSSPITIDTPGAGAAAFSSYGAEIVSRYERNWLVPADAVEDNSVVQIVVTIARDGHVLDARVIRPCGRAAIDKSVRETLNRVRAFPPFPPGSTDDQRTFNVDFNLKAKRSAG